MKSGDLIKNKENGQLGIVLKIVKDQVTVFMGDGLPFIGIVDKWETVPFYPSATIPASFIELVEAYRRERAQFARGLLKVI